MDPWTVCRPVVADSHHFDEEQDLDPHRSLSRIHIKMKRWIRGSETIGSSYIIIWDVEIYTTVQQAWEKHLLKRENLKDFQYLFTVLLIRDVFPGSWFLPIPDPKTETKDRGEKKFVVLPFCHNFHKIENYFSYEEQKKKVWANFQRIIELFTQKNCQQVLKNMGLGSGIRTIPGPGVKRHRIPDPYPQHWIIQHCRPSDL